MKAVIKFDAESDNYSCAFYGYGNTKVDWNDMRGESQRAFLDALGRFAQLFMRFVKMDDEGKEATND